MKTPRLAGSVEAKGRRALAFWLLACCATVFATVVVGGMTRLTHSGLSIVEWQPIVGVVPPRSESDWQEAFAKYRRTPEYQRVNAGMGLAAFKRIFWWEYAHRAVARANGLVFLLPLAYFAVRRRLTRELLLKLSVVFALGGLQGVLGWYMVVSGLVEDPHVSHFRLTAHLGLAFLIWAALLWLALDLLRPPEAAGETGASPGIPRFAAGLALLSFLMILSGGLVAGLHAGALYNTFPLMSGYMVPPLAFSGRPLLRDLVSNVATVQFNHRVIGWTLALSATAFCLWVGRVGAPRRVRLAARALLAGIALQFVLGVATLVLLVPLPLAAAHQAGAMVVFGLVVWVNEELR